MIAVNVGPAAGVCAWVNQRNVIELHGRESAVNGSGRPEQASLLDAQRAESYLRRRVGQELAEASSLAQVQATADDRATTAKARIARTAALAGALAAVGAIPETAAVRALDGLRAALVQQGLLPASELDNGPGAPGPSRQPDTVRAFPAGVAVECEIDGFGFPLRVRFGALVTDVQSARITWRAAYTDPQLTGPGAWRQGPDPWVAFRGVTAADDMGRRYEGGLGVSHGRFSHGDCGEGTTFRWEGWSWLDPAPPEEARWLAVTLAGKAPVRIEMDRAREPAVTAVALDPAGAADRYLDARSVTLLTGDPEHPGRSRSADVVAMAADLLGAGVLQPASPSLARLAAVARRRGLRLPGPLAAIPPAPLPADWASVQDRSGQGASGVVFAAAVLPEIEGVRCVITELASRPDITTLRVFAPAWPLIDHHGTGGPQHDDRYHWLVRDDLGNSYALTAYLRRRQHRRGRVPAAAAPPGQPSGPRAGDHAGRPDRAGLGPHAAGLAERRLGLRPARLAGRVMTAHCGRLPECQRRSPRQHDRSSAWHRSRDSAVRQARPLMPPRVRGVRE